MATESNHPVLDALLRVSRLPNANEAIEAWAKVRDLIATSGIRSYPYDPTLTTSEREDALYNRVVNAEANAGLSNDALADIFASEQDRDADSLATLMYQEFSEAFEPLEPSATIENRAKCIRAAALSIFARTASSEDLSDMMRADASIVDQARDAATVLNDPVNGLREIAPLLTKPTPLTPAPVDIGINPALAQRKQVEDRARKIKEVLDLIQKNALTDKERVHVAELLKDAYVVEGVRKGNLNTVQEAIINDLIAPTSGAAKTQAQRRGSVNNQPIDASDVIEPNASQGVSQGNMEQGDEVARQAPSGPNDTSVRAARLLELLLRSQGDTDEPMSAEDREEMKALLADGATVGYAVKMAQSKDPALAQMIQMASRAVNGNNQRQRQSDVNATPESEIAAKHRERIAHSAGRSGIPPEAMTSAQAQARMQGQQVPQQMQQGQPERVGFFTALNRLLGGMVASLGTPSTPEQRAARMNLAFDVASETKAKAFDSYEQAKSQLDENVSMARESLTHVKNAFAEREEQIEGLTNAAEHYYPGNRAEALVKLFHAANLSRMTEAQRKEADPQGQMTQATEIFSKIAPEQQEAIIKNFAKCDELNAKEISAHTKLSECRRRMPELVNAKTKAIASLDKHGNLDREMAESLKVEAENDVEEINEMESEVSQTDAAKMKPEDEEAHRNALMKSIREMMAAIKRILDRVIRFFKGNERTSEPSL